ncbi:hypothetical protein ACRS6B_19800 [Nocardia asteroides]
MSVGPFTRAPIRITTKEAPVPLGSSEALRLAVAVRDLLTVHPRLHDPNIWVGETHGRIVGCIAGWTAILHGARLHHGPPTWRNDHSEFAFVVGPTGDPLLIRDYATDVLGLTEDERDQLFTEPETAADALNYLDELIAAAPAVLESSTTGSGNRCPSVRSGPVVRTGASKPVLDNSFG